MLFSNNRKKRPIRFVDETLGIIQGYIAKWGDSQNPDAYGTWFDRDNPPQLGLDYLPFPMMYEHGMDESIGINPIGDIVRVWIDDVGIAFEGQLHRHGAFFGRIVAEITEGVLATSSASAEHLAQFDNLGRFVKWFLSEVSLTKDPAEFTMPLVKLVRSNGSYSCYLSECGASPLSVADDSQNGLTLETRSLTMFRVFDKNGRALNKPAVIRAYLDKRALYDEQGNELDPQAVLQMLVESGMSVEELMTMIQQMQAPMNEERSDDEAPEQTPVTIEGVQAQLAALQAQFDSANNRSAPNSQLDELIKLMREKESAPPEKTEPVRNAGNSQRRAPRISIVDRLAPVSGGALALGAMLLRADGKEPSDEYSKALAYKALEQVENGELQARDLYAVRAKMAGLSDMKKSDVFSSDIKHIRSFIRADEVMNPSNVSDGAGGTTTSSWVDDYQGSDVWASLREEAKVFDAMRAKGMPEAEIPSGFRGTEINLEGSDFTFYTTSATQDYNAASGNPTPTTTPSLLSNPTLTLPVGKLSAFSIMAEELFEDSIVNQLEQAQAKLRTQVPEQVEFVIINGDTATGANTNINLSDGTPASSPAAPNYLVLNGLLQAGIIQQTATNAANTNTADLYNNLYGEFPDEYMDEERLLYLMDKQTHLIARALPEFKTQDVNSQATVEKGKLTNIWGIDNIPTSRLKQAHSTGKLTPSTVANHIYGRVILVRPDECYFAYKRRGDIKMVEYPIQDSRALVVHFRFGFIIRNTNAVKVAYGVKTKDSA